MNVTLHLTTRCSLRCTYCYAPPGRLRAVDMTRETALRAVELAATVSPESCGIVFFGGEPLLRADLVREVVGYCRERERTRPATRFHFKITTNGLGLDEEFLDFAVREDVFVALSFDGVAAAHDRHRVHADGRGSWAAVDRAATALLLRRPYAPVLLVVTPETVAHYAESVEHLVGRGFRYVIASPDYGADWHARDLRALAAQYRALARRYERWMAEERKVWFSPFEVKLASHIHGADYARERCELGRRQLSVGPDGRIWPCVQFVQDGADDTFVMGDVWRGLDPARQARVAALAGREHEPCTRCALAPRCNHTCGCLNWQATGSVERVSPVLCAHERLLVPIVDALGARLWRRRDAFFLQKRYNALYPLLSLIEDESPAASAGVHE